MGLANPFTAGTPITAASLAAAAPLAAFKYSDQNSGVNNTTLVNDGDLNLFFLAAGTYIFDGMIIYEASATARYEATFAPISGATTSVWSPGIYTGAGGTAFVQPALPLAFGITITAGTPGGTSQNQWLTVQGSVVMGGNAGNLQWQFCQATSDNTNCNTRAGSWLRAWKIA